MRKRASLPLLTLLALLVAAPASADLIFLKNGRVLEGRVVEAGDKLIIEMAFGSVTISRDQVERIESRTSPVEQYRRKIATLDPEDVDAVWQLAQWCEQKALPGRARKAYRQVIELDPDHAGARKALGYRRFKDRWLTPDEYMLATGHVRVDGRWLNAEAYEAMQAEAAAAEPAQEEAASDEADATSERDEALALLEAERERLEAERLRLQAERERMRREQMTREERQWRARFGWPTWVFVEPQTDDPEPEDPAATPVRPRHPSTPTPAPTRRTSPPPEGRHTPPETRSDGKRGDTDRRPEREADAAHEEAPAADPQ